MTEKRQDAESRVLEQREAIAEYCKAAAVREARVRELTAENERWRLSVRELIAENERLQQPFWLRADRADPATLSQSELCEEFTLTCAALVSAEARVRELEAENERAMAHVLKAEAAELAALQQYDLVAVHKDAETTRAVAAESRLAAATALLMSLRGFGGIQLAREVSTFLANQPAAPTRCGYGRYPADLGPALGHHAAPLPGWDNIERKTTAPTRTEARLDSAIAAVKSYREVVARTEAEQAVLDAVFEQSYCEQEDGCAGGPSETYYYETVAVFEAYRIARRGIK